MLTLNEFKELREKLKNNEIGIEFVKKKLDPFWQDLKDGKRSWKTKDWIERKKKFIKEKCEKCSSTEILTIQHNSHPKTYNDFKREITSTYTNQLINNNKEIDKEIFKNYKLKGFYGDYFMKLIVQCFLMKKKIIEFPYVELERFSGYSKTTSGNLNLLIKCFFYLLAVAQCFFNKIIK